MDDLLHKQVSEVDVKCRSEYSSAFLYGSASAGEILKRVAEDSISLSTSTLTSTASAGAGYEAEKENKAAAGAAKEESQDTAPDTHTHACICTEPRIVPLYVMNYIFDGDELNDEQVGLLIEGELLVIDRGGYYSILVVACVFYHIL